MKAKILFISIFISFLWLSLVEAQKIEMQPKKLPVEPKPPSVEPKISTEIPDITITYSLNK